MARLRVYTIDIELSISIVYTRNQTLVCESINEKDTC